MERTFTWEVELPDGRRVPVAVARKRVKNLNLRLRSDGGLSMSMPERMPLARAEDFLERHAAWIARQLEQREARERDGLVPTEGRDAGTIPLWGRLVRVGEGTDIEALYRHELACTLPEVVARMEERMGVRTLGWQVRRMKTRWGSCTPRRRTIRINAALAAYPPTCLEAVVAHELVHLLEPTHNARFHRLLDAFCPGNRATHALLRQPARTVAEEALAEHADRKST